MRIEVVDWYDGDREVIGIAHSMCDANALWQARVDDTDGECDVVCYLTQTNAKPKDINHIVRMYNPNYEEGY